MAEEVELASVARSYRLVRRVKPLIVAGLESLAKRQPVSLPAFHSAELAAYVAEVLQERPILRTYASGINDAVAVAQLELKAGLASDLQAKVTELETQIAKLQNRVSPLTGGLPGQSGSKSFEEMTPEEQGAFLRNEAVAIDAAA